MAEHNQPKLTSADFPDLEDENAIMEFVKRGQDEQQTDEVAVLKFLRNRGIDGKATKDKILDSVIKAIIRSEKSNLELEENLTKVTTDKDALAQDLAQAQDDLAGAQTMLHDLDEVNTQLSTKVRSFENSNESINEPLDARKKVLALLGPHSKSITPFIEKKDCFWQRIEEINDIAKLSDICQDHEALQELCGYHKIVIMLGSVDIEQLGPTDTSVALANRYCKLISIIREVTGSELLIVKLPPASTTLQMSLVIVFNDSLRAGEGVTVASSPKLRLTPRSKLYDLEGNLTELASKMIGDMINTNLTIPEESPKGVDNIEQYIRQKNKGGKKNPKGKPAPKPAKPSGYGKRDNMMKVFIPVDRHDWGKVIGEDGSTINEIQDKTNTRISMIHAGTRGYVKAGALIKGTSMTAVQIAKQVVKSQIENDSDQENMGSPVQKRGRKNYD